MCFCKPNSLANSTQWHHHNSDDRNHLLTTIAETIYSATQRLLAAGLPISDARLEARLLFQHASNKTAEQVIASYKNTAQPKETNTFNEIVDRRCIREPLAYILGNREFYGRNFGSDRSSLVPRQESELLITHALDFIDSHSIDSPRILDIGTGSGILAITLALELSDSKITATDISPESLQLARINAAHLGVDPDRIKFTLDDIRSTRLLSNANQPFSFVISNPPYIRTSAIDELEPEVSIWEPVQALDGGPEGMDIVRHIIRALPDQLDIHNRQRPCGSFIEIDPSIAAQTLTLAHETLPHANTSIFKDNAGLERVLSVKCVS